MDRLAENVLSFTVSLLVSDEFWYSPTAHWPGYSLILMENIKVPCLQVSSPMSIGMSVNYITQLHFIVSYLDSLMSNPRHHSGCQFQVSENSRFTLGKDVLPQQVNAGGKNEKHRISEETKTSKGW